MKIQAARDNYLQRNRTRRDLHSTHWRRGIDFYHDYSVEVGIIGSLKEADGKDDVELLGESLHAEKVPGCHG